MIIKKWTYKGFDIECSKISKSDIWKFKAIMYKHKDTQEEEYCSIYVQTYIKDLKKAKKQCAEEIDLEIEKGLEFRSNGKQGWEVLPHASDLT